MHTNTPQILGSSWGLGRRSCGWVLGVLLGLLGGWQVGQAADFMCPSVGGVGDVACLIQAIKDANANGEENTIILEAGTYTLTDVDNTTNGPNGLPSITSPLTITRVGADTTIIERQTSGSPTPPAFRLLHVAATGSLTLNGLTLQGGFLGPAFLGGGIRNDGTLTLTNSTLAYNTAFLGGGGGGIYNHGTLTITNSTLAYNTASSSGGGIRNDDTLTLTNSTLAYNTTVSGNGGGIYSTNGTLTLTNCSLTHNTATGNGGGIYSTNGTLTLTNCSLTNSTAHLHGGGIYHGGTLTLTNSTLAYNTAVGGDDGGGSGGGISGGGTLSIINSTLAYNTATGQSGGGINNGGGTLSIINSTLAYNTATDTGGGIFHTGTLTLTNSTLAYNTVSSNYVFSGGGGIYRSPGFFSSVTLQNTILALNTAPNAPSPRNDCVGDVTSLGTNLIGDSRGCTITRPPGVSDLTGDPGLDDFTDDGTPGNGHFPLLETSQAIDRGNDAACPPTDQLGHPRVDQCDIGAIEFQPDTTAPVITVSATPDTLWPPNGKLVPVTISGAITDADSETEPASGVDPMTVSYEVTDEYGSIHLRSPVSVQEDDEVEGTDVYTFTIDLQALRNDDDADGRHYTITVYAADLAGNEGSTLAIVTVPHDRGQNRSLAAR